MINLHESHVEEMEFEFVAPGYVVTCAVDWAELGTFLLNSVLSGAMIPYNASRSESTLYFH